MRLENDDGAGSAVVVYAGERTFVLTCAHVAKNAKLTAEFFSWRDGRVLLGEKFDTVVVASDELLDLALMEVKCPPGRGIALPLAEDPRLGEEVVVLGCPLGYRVRPSFGHLTVIDGTFQERDALATDATVIFGNSGGALVAQRGGKWVLLGVPEAICAVGFNQPVPTMNWAIPASTVHKFLIDQFADFILDPELLPESMDELRQWYNCGRP